MKRTNGHNNSVISFFASCSISPADLFAAVCTAFVIASVVFLCGGSFTELTYVRHYPWWLFAAVFAVSLCAVLAAGCILKSHTFISRLLLFCSLIMSVILCIQEPENIFFNLGIAFIIVIIIKYADGRGALSLAKPQISRRTSFYMTLGIFLVFFAAVFFFTAAKYKSFQHGTFDFGIFAQMFEQMAKTGLPNTTVERSELLSHFAVHFSPVFYLLLPGYLVFRTPLYLLAAQAFVVGFGVFPVRRICLELGLSPRTSVLAAAVFALYPTMANGCFYDFHENKILTVFLLYLACFALKGNRAGIAVFALLTLSVKEDAFIYVLAVCIWMLVTKRRRGFACGVAALSIAYFFFACAMINLCGGEIMTGRFDNFTLTQDGGLFEVIRTCVTDIGYLIKEVFAGADTEAFREVTYGGQKLEFVLWTAVPLMFTPFLRKKSSELCLLLPLLVINLMPRWMYQFDIDYQYTYGTAALMIFSALLALSECGRDKRRRLLAAMLCLCTVFTVSAAFSKAQRQALRYFPNKEAYDATEEALDQIPSDASVTAYGYIAPHLYYVDDLHSSPEYYGDYEKTDYYVIDTRYARDEHTQKMYDAMGDDYSLLCETGYIKIYRLIGQER